MTPRRWSTSRVKFPLLALCMVAVGACSENCDPLGPSTCGDLTHTVHAFRTPFEFPLPERAFLDGGLAHFTWSHEFTGLCSTGPDADNEMDFFIYWRPTQPTPVPLNFRLLGRVYHAPGIQPYTGSASIGNLVSKPSREFTTVRNIGLKQGNALGDPARIVTELEMQFNSSGRIDDDRANIAAIVDYIEFDLRYRLPK